MGRILKGIILAVLFVLPLALLTGRDTTATLDPIGPEQTGLIGSPAPPVTTTPAFGTPAPTPTVFDPERTPEPPTPTPVLSEEVKLLVRARSDLEALASAQLRPDARPVGWNGEVDVRSPDIGLLTRLDLELLATDLINPSQRPRGWIGAVASTPYYIARDVRHDLELLASVYYQEERPAGWLGADPLMRCNRATQTLITLLERGGVYRLNVETNDPDFCRLAELEVTSFTETRILGNAQIAELFADDLIILSPNNVNTEVAVAFLDSAATRSVGVIPNGTPLTPIARSYADFSRMMLVAGDNFEVFVEYTSTSVTERQFRNLPNAASLELDTFCFAPWCDTR